MFTTDKNNFTSDFDKLCVSVYSTDFIVPTFMVLPVTFGSFSNTFIVSECI